MLDVIYQIIPNNHYKICCLFFDNQANTLRKQKMAFQSMKSKVF